MEGARRRLGSSPPVVQSSLEQKSAIIRSKHAAPMAIVWCVASVLLALDVFIIGLLVDCWLLAWVRDDVVIVIECIALALAVLNTIAAVSTAVWPALLAHPVFLTAHQMRLLAVDTSDVGFRSVGSTPGMMRSTPARQPDDLGWLFRLRETSKHSTPTLQNNTSPHALSGGSSSFDGPSMLSPILGSGSGGRLQRTSVSPFSLKSHGGLPTSLAARIGARTSPYTKPDISIHSDTQLRELLSRSNDTQSLGRSLDGSSLNQSHQAMMTSAVYGGAATGSSMGSYDIGIIADEEAKENMSPTTMSVTKSPSGSLRMSTSPVKGGKTSDESSPNSPSIRRSNSIDVRQSGGGMSASPISASTPSATSAAAPLWIRYSLSVDDLDEHVRRLRRWLAATILRPLVRKIDKMNERFEQQSRPDLRIGEASIASLQHVLLTKANAFYALHQLMPYLELSTNQNYLVKRLRELSADAYLRDFVWNSGGTEPSSNGHPRPWGEHLPTDAELVWHMFSAYMDGQLPANPLANDYKPFSSAFTLRSPSKPALAQTAPDSFYVNMATIHPPHFELMVKGGGERLDVGKGRGNLFRTILLLLQHARLHSEQRLDQLALGPSGLNLLWVLEF